jgi:predicted dinucleotide-binding enzyme
MRIAIIGVGNVGTALSRAFAALGHTVVLSAQDPKHAVARALDIAGDLGAEVGVQAAQSNAEAVDGANLIVLAIPSVAIASVTEDIRAHIHDAIVVDPTNPVNAGLSDLLTDSGSAAEGIALLLPGVPVVKAFNTVFAANLTKPIVNGLPLDGFVAGNDEAAKTVVAELLADGLRATGHRRVGDRARIGKDGPPEHELQHALRLAMANRMETPRSDNLTRFGPILAEGRSTEPRYGWPGQKIRPGADAAGHVRRGQLMAGPWRAVSPTPVEAKAQAPPRPPPD